MGLSTNYMPSRLVRQPTLMTAINSPQGFSERLLALADRPAGTWILVGLALAEATVFPAPTEAMLIALTLGRPRRVIWFTAVGTVASATGGVAGYYLGAEAFETVVQPLLDAYRLTPHMQTLARLYGDNMLLALTTSGYTPVPYMLYTAMAGAARLPLHTFVVGSVLGRALKYAPIAAVAYFAGPAVHRLLRRYGLIAAGLVAVVILGVLLL